LVDAYANSETISFELIIVIITVSAHFFDKQHHFVIRKRYCALGLGLELG